MSHQWLAAANFERSHELISAINTLVIATQLSLTGKSNGERLEEVTDAQTRLLPFLKEFSTLVKTVECNEDAPVLGADPRLCTLARNFVVSRRQNASPALQEAALERVVWMLHSNSLQIAPRTDRMQLVELLRALRSLLEENAHADVVGLIGAF